MKFSKFFSCITVLGLAFTPFSYAEIESVDGAIFDPNQCYYWIGLHDRELYKYKPDQLQTLIAELSEEGVAKSSERRRAALLLGARLNRIEIDSDTLSDWMSNLTGTPERKTDEDNLIHEIVMTLGAQNQERELHQLLNSENLPVREAAFSALLFYADHNDLESMRERERKRVASLSVETSRLVDLYKTDSERAAELAKKLAEKSRFAPFAVGQLRDYYAYQNFEKSNEDWLRIIGKNSLIEMRSTATNRDMFSPARGGYLEDSLTNKFFLQKLDQILNKASSRTERLKLERVFRDASAQSGLVDEIYNTPLFYLLGFELTDEEKAYLLEEAGLSEGQLLPTGQMHLIGYELENLQSPVAEIPPTPSVEEVAEVIEEVNTPEPATEETLEVVTAPPIEEELEEPSNRWLWLIGLLVVVGGLGLVLRRKN
ncbi:MAG: hypothetical protein CML13_15340 [Puniceicoccaceae bacterium]|mgnify:CR=1 FL=1|nr:hypothetical protein [Puniceicoccaceae bacterium]|tara:strand:+ start:1177 stop:2463 length:1287 start_codon:yes stop_codon:yes gene_type:complete